MCFHKWKEYKDKETKKYYRICTKCGIAQRGTYDLVFGYTQYITDKTLCRTNNWIDKDTWMLRYNLIGE